ncbi:FAD-binding oxidoreductase [Streptomyces albus subsp. chlorinus]|uniref:NAD(P)/FAD-dependent oxidoreductase n=1 Tax=Streptomyces albus TaxID=1888 RepID=UPI00156FB738|nr:FAD-binding oxidoreductase [Streptomyces albus]NSC25577.1 FAD-binding oxidoreductase [Streptomyces albus subsp. chlorinus]
MTTYRNGDISHWMRASVPPDLSGQRSAGRTASASARGTRSRVPLPAEKQDLVIVGGGLTGLWAAYYASLDHPDRAITVLEAEEVGYGASGRNGGWLSTLIPGNRAVYAKSVDAAGGNGTEAVRAFQQAMFTAIDETLAVLGTEGIDAHQTQGGNLKVAQTPAGMERIRATYRSDLTYGYSTDDVRLLDAAEARARVNVEGAVGGILYARTTAVDPALLTRGLAAAVAARGVRICEGTRVRHISKGTVLTDRGPVRGTTVLSCLEAYSGTVTGDAPGLGARQLVPVNSSIIVTEQLPEETWERIGWQGRECLSDAAHTFVYAQRTADGRIAIGGRGSPYAYNSGTPGSGAVDRRTVAQLRGKLAALFPGIDMPIAHAWRGAIGVTRDWCAGIHFDPDTRVGVARGYAGHGVTATQLAARTLLDRAEGRSTPRTALPWNDHDSGLWEPEPLRWLGVHAMYRLFEVADGWEQYRRAGRTSLIARFGSRLAGLHE